MLFEMRLADMSLETETRKKIPFPSYDYSFLATWACMGIYNGGGPQQIDQGFLCL